jgi:creatinine amidohydrolase
MSKQGMLERFWIWELTRPAFEEWLQKEHAPVIIVGIGSIEQHGPHLPLGTDSLYAQNIIHEVAKRTNSVCIQPCWPGYSPHHMGFKGTVTLDEDTLLAVLMDVVDSLSEHGIKRFLLVNAHGGNRNIVSLAVQLSKRYSNVMIASPTGPNDTDLAKKIKERRGRHWDVHSGPTETSYAMLLFPELIEMWRLNGWIPTLQLDKMLMDFLDPDREDYELIEQIRAACAELNTDDFTSSGIYGTNDPRTADVDEAQLRYEERVHFLVNFINVWKTIPVPPAFTD